MSSILVPPAPPAVGAAYNPPPRKRWTSKEFHQLWDEGKFEGQNLILVDGEILHMPAPNPPHSTSLTLADYRLKDVFRTGYVVRVQLGIDLAQDTDPIPDLAVVTGAPRDYVRHPTTAVLIVEVSETSLAYDTGDKASLYAAGGIQDYWVIDLLQCQLHVFRDPRPDSSKTHGFSYAQATVHDSSATVSPLAAPQAHITVADLLP